MMKFGVIVFIVVILVVVFTGGNLQNLTGNSTDNPSTKTDNPADNPTSNPQIGLSVPKSTEIPVCKLTSGYPDGTVNLRNGAGMQFGVLVVLTEGDQLDNLNQDENGWLFVRQSRSGIEGWVNSQFVSCK
jgi:hypothetical protein